MNGNETFFSVVLISLNIAVTGVGNVKDVIDIVKRGANEGEFAINISSPE